MGLSSDYLIWVIYVRGNFILLREPRKYLGRNRLTDGPCSYPMFGEMDESLQNFQGNVGS